MRLGKISRGRLVLNVYHVTIACNKGAVSSQSNLVFLNTRLLDPGGEISHDNYDFCQAPPLHSHQPSQKLTLHYIVRCLKPSLKRRRSPTSLQIRGKML